jgi:hypothetical protein
LVPNSWRYWEEVEPLRRWDLEVGSDVALKEGRGVALKGILGSWTLPASLYFLATMR